MPSESPVESIRARTMRKTLPRYMKIDCQSAWNQVEFACEIYLPCFHHLTLGVQWEYLRRYINLISNRQELTVRIRPNSPRKDIISLRRCFVSGRLDALKWLNDRFKVKLWVETTIVNAPLPFSRVTTQTHQSKLDTNGCYPYICLLRSKDIRVPTTNLERNIVFQHLWQ
jgi:hypothetical protein